MENRIPPQSIVAEKALLGNIIISGELEEYIDSFNPDYFYNPKNKKLAQILVKMVSVNENIDFVTVSEHLKGEDDYINNLINSELGDIESLINIIREKYNLRKIISIASDISKKAYNEEPSEALISSSQSFLAALSGFKEENVYPIRKALKSLYDDINRNFKGKQNELTGIPTGLTEYDRFSSGSQDGNLIIIAGETSNGKTSLALKFASTASKFNHKTLIYSYEMSDTELAARLLAMESGLSAKRLQYFKLEDFEFEKVSKDISKILDTELYVEALRETSFDYLQKSIRVNVLKNGMELIIIDYLQLIQNPMKGANKAIEVAEIANNLKALAKTLNIPIILISQLARDKGNPKPTVSRLKNSGDIENAADVILLTFLPANYGYVDFECKGKNYPAKGHGLLLVAKGRNIGTTQIPLDFVPDLTLFKDYTETEYPSAPY